MLRRSDPDFRRMIKRPGSLWVVVAMDPIGPRLAWMLRGSRITPNQITLVSLVVAVAAATSYALGALVAGAILSQVRFLLDCTDGRLARLRGTSSPLGGFFDLLADVTSILLMSAGLIVGVESDALAAALLVFLVVYAILAWIRTQERRITPLPTAPPSGAIKRYPTSVEAETLVLFVAPLLPWNSARLALIGAGTFILLGAAVLDLRTIARGLRSEGDRR